MAKKKYKKKPESWYCIQYTGINPAELIAEYPPHITYNDNQEQLLLDGIYVIVPNAWVMQDNLGTVSTMVAEQFQAFFEVQGGGPSEAI